MSWKQRTYIGVLLIVLGGCQTYTPDEPPTPPPPTSSRLPFLSTAHPTALPETDGIAPNPTELSVAQTPTPEAVAVHLTPALNTQNLPQGGRANWQLEASGLEKPVAIVASPDNSGRLFIVEQAGRIRILQNGDLFPEPFLDIQPIVGSRGNEQGLLGLAFHPDYARNGFFYLNYTNKDGDTVVARFQVSSDNPDSGDSNSRKRLLKIAQPFPNHNGGALVFGPDGYLYIGMGDGGAANDPQGNAQATNTLLGKILRIDVDDGERYAIPVDNPFVNGGGLPEIWAYGLRNPWRISFDRLTGDLYIADVGQNKWEEINYLPLGSSAGANFGWDFREGAHEFEASPPNGYNLIDPVAEYGHDQGCSVTGGVVYRGSQLPEWFGVYLYADYCSGRIWGLLHAADEGWRNANLFDTGLNITSFGEDQSGEVYFVSHDGGVYHLVP